MRNLHQPATTPEEIAEFISIMRNPLKKGISIVLVTYQRRGKSPEKAYAVFDGSDGSYISLKLKEDHTLTLDIEKILQIQEISLVQATQLLTVMLKM